MKIFKGLNFKNQVWPLAILALSDVAVFAFPSYMSNFIPNLHKSMGILQGELSMLRSIYGSISILIYFVSMSFVDKFKCRTLILTGLFSMLVLGVWYSLVPLIFGENESEIPYSANFINYLLIFIGFSLTIKLLYWSPLWKLVAMQGEKNEVGTMNGIQGSINGLLGCLLACIGVVFYFQNPKVNNLSLGFPILSGVYTLFLGLSIFLTWKYVKEDSSKLEKTDFKTAVRNIFSHAKNLKLWIYSLVVMGIYMYQMGLSTYTDYLTNIIGISVAIVFILGLIRTYLMRLLASFFMGKLADKINNYILYLFFGLVLASGLTFMAIALPGFNNDFIKQDNKLLVQILAGINIVILGLVTWSLVTIRWSPISTQLDIDIKHYASAVAFISTIAFTPDAFFQAIKSAIEHRFNFEIETGRLVVNQTGSQLILGVSLSVGMLGMLLALGLQIFINKKHKKNISLK